MSFSQVRVAYLQKADKTQDTAFPKNIKKLDLMHKMSYINVQNSLQVCITAV